jgi:hypothetical protein
MIRSTLSLMCEVLAISLLMTLDHVNDLMRSFLVSFDMIEVIADDPFGLMEYGAWDVLRLLYM